MFLDKFCCLFCRKFKDDSVGKKYIDRYKNNFEEVTIPESAKKDIYDLDTSKMSVWICDRDFNFVHATNDESNGLLESEYLGKNIKDVLPVDFAKYLFEFHKLAQQGIETNRNLVINGHLVFFKLKPLRFIDDGIFASALYIIPYK
jgi:hypothetical protein